MAKRITPQDPLQNAGPALQPTARPYGINVGATPVAERSPLMELAQSLRGFQPELSDRLRVAAAQADQDALALGELTAIKAGAAKRLGELDQLIKEGVDAGTIPHARAPAFERGFRARVGSEIAQSQFQEALLARLPEATKVGYAGDDSANPRTHSQRVEAMVAETYSKFADMLHPGDLYAREAFDKVAAGVIAGFRQRASEGYLAAYKAAGEQQMADDASERLLTLATAPEDERPANAAAVKLNLDQLRAELPKHEVTKFYMTGVVAPTVEKLVSRRKFTEARNILDEVSNLDVTGTGGLLGQTSLAKSVIADLQAKIERERRITADDEFTALRRNQQARQLVGETAAAAELLKLRSGNEGRLPEDRYALINAYAKAHSDDPEAVRAYTATVHAEYENEAKYRTNERLVAELEAGFNSLRKDNIEFSRARLTDLWNRREIAPSDFARLTDKLNKLDSLYGAYDEGDVNRFKRDLYAAKTLVPGQTTINFGVDLGSPKDPNAVGTLWDSLSPERQRQHEEQVTAFFKSALEDDIVNRVGDPLKVGAEKATSLDNATTKARAFAVSTLRSLAAEQAKDKTSAAVARQQANIRNGSQTRRAAVRPSLSFAYATGETAPADVPGDAPKPVTKTARYKLPVDAKADIEAVRADRALPRAERDIAELRIDGPIGQSVSLKRLAEDVQNNEVPEARVKARELYGIGKSSLGFTPEEIKAGKTKHGVEFTPAEIDPKRISVFRDVSELNKHWNGGEPDETFLAIGDAVDPNDTMTARELYLAQRALLTR